MGSWCPNIPDSITSLTLANLWVSCWGVVRVEPPQNSPVRGRGVVVRLDPCPESSSERAVGVVRVEPHPKSFSKRLGAWSGWIPSRILQ